MISSIVLIKKDISYVVEGFVMNEKVVLVDKENNKIGTIDKLKAHQEGGRLHRAFSIFVFNSDDELLLQKRVAEKYHSAGLWSNTCCSHPRPRESFEKATKRKLEQEMGFTCELEKAFDFIYKKKVGDLTEWELDHVFVGRYDGEPNPNPKEVSEWKWISPSKLKKDIQEHPDKYTAWFKVIIKKHFSKLEKTLEKL